MSVFACENEGIKPPPPPLAEAWRFTRVKTRARTGQGRCVTSIIVVIVCRLSPWVDSVLEAFADMVGRKEKGTLGFTSLGVDLGL